MHRPWPEQATAVVRTPGQSPPQARRGSRRSTRRGQQYPTPVPVPRVGRRGHVMHSTGTRLRTAQRRQDPLPTARRSPPCSCTSPVPVARRRRQNPSCRRTRRRRRPETEPPAAREAPRGTGWRGRPPLSVRSHSRGHSRIHPIRRGRGGRADLRHCQAWTDCSTPAGKGWVQAFGLPRLAAARPAGLRAWASPLTMTMARRNMHAASTSKTFTARTLTPRPRAAPTKTMTAETRAATTGKAMVPATMSVR